jgi:hypothetical protein
VLAHLAAACVVIHLRASSANFCEAATLAVSA